MGDLPGGDGDRHPPQERPVDWEALQEWMDDAFHHRGSAYPCGSQEHKEVVGFIPKLAKLLAARQKGEHSSQPPSTSSAGALGLPQSYHPRYRVNVAVVPSKERVGAALQSARRRREPALEAVLGPPADGLAALADEYRSMLAQYEDFRQKKAFSRLLKLRADQAALPIAPFESQLVEALRTRQVVVLAGDTGCGKSTQLPQFLLRAGFSKVAVTQPRRISAMALCRRVAYETLNEHGDEIAYQIRFDSSRGLGTKVTFMTEGILLRRLAGDTSLKDFDCIVLDEVHERHLSTDFLLALLRAIAARRPSLRVVLMSATINVHAYSDYFGGVPVISVPGRLHPIKVVYLPPTPDAAAPDARRWGYSSSQQAASVRRSRDEANALVAKGGKRAVERTSPTPYLRVLQRIDQEVPRDERGDVLVFLSGMEDIAVVADALQEYAQRTRRWVILKLHSSLAVEEQDRVFDVAEDGVRKCILSTNIAETSVTIDGIRFVVDSGRSKEMLHDSGSGVGSLQEGWVSRASADQRKGRAGRTGPGVCYRLYSEEEFLNFPPFNLPEIQRVRLEAVVLQIKQLAGAASDPRRFGFIDPPPAEGLEDAIRALKNAQALGEGELLTPLGSILSTLPVDIHIGKMLILGCILGCANTVLTIAAALSTQTPFVRLPSDGKGGGVAAARREVESADGDPFTLLLLFEQWIRVKDDIRSGRSRSTSSRKWCQARGVEEQRLYEIAKLKRQFEDLLKANGLSPSRGQQEREQIGQRRNGGDKSSRRRREDKARLRKLQRQHEKDSRRERILRAEGNDYEDDSEASGDGEQQKPNKRRRQEAARDRRGVGAEDLKQWDLELTVDVSAMADAAACDFTAGDVALLKFVISAALHPNLAVAAMGNAHRRDADVRFHTDRKADATFHPSSCLAPHARELGPQNLVAYVEALETRSLFLCNITPVPALGALLLNGTRLDTDMEGSKIVVDSWLLLRILDGNGPKALVSAARARRALSSALAAKLREAKTRHTAECGVAAAKAPDNNSGDGRQLPGSLALRMPEWAEAAAAAWGNEEAARRVGVGELAEMLAGALMWDLRYSVERLGASAAAAHYVRRDEAAQIPISSSGSAAVEGVQVAPWLTVGALRSIQSDLAAHARLPTLRRHWLCPGCSQKMIGTAAEISEHIEGCKAASALPSEQLEAAYGNNPSADCNGQGKWELQGLSGPLELSRAQDPQGPSSQGVLGAPFNGGEGEAEQSARVATNAGGDEEDRQLKADANRKEHFCRDCNELLLLTPVEILQHRRQHSSAKPRVT